MNSKLLGNTEQLLVHYLVPNKSMYTTLNSKILALVKQIGLIIPSFTLNCRKINDLTVVYIFRNVLLI